MLLAIALCVALTSAGVLTMYQVMGMNNDLYPRSQLEQTQLSRLLLEIERDFYSASRAYVWAGKVEENIGALASNWVPLYTATHTVSVKNSGSDLEIWPIAISPTNDGWTTTAGSFLYYWTNNGASSSIRIVPSDSTDKYYYTIVLLKGFTKISAVIYLCKSF